jgi:CRISPR-associated protein Cmr6
MAATISNIGLWYYRTFFSELHKPETPDYESESAKKDFASWLKIHYDPALKVKWDDFTGVSSLFKVIENKDTSFVIKTIYPGLVCGIGYEHELGFTNEFKLGFSFDHTTGLPYIPGSSVKGTLRSAFKHNGYPKSILEDWIEAIKKPESGKSCPYKLKDRTDELQIVVEQTDWKKLEDHIFEGKNYADGETINTYKTDMFFDCFISNTSEANDFKFLADDYITSHQNKIPELSPFKNPNPVRFLKVRSDVEFTFGFRLSDIDLGGDISFKKEFKCELFKQILLDLGIGAKTNVGYGQFVNAIPDNGDSKIDQPLNN